MLNKKKQKLCQLLYCSRKTDFQIKKFSERNANLSCKLVIKASELRHRRCADCSV